MLPSDAVKLLKGSLDEKKQLFDFFVQKAMDAGLEDWEGIMMDAIKKELFPEKKVVDMSATLSGTGGAIA